MYYKNNPKKKIKRLKSNWICELLTESATGELTEQLRVRQSSERRRPYDDHVILCSTFEFLFEFQVVRTSNRSKFEGPLYFGRTPWKEETTWKT
jgi:hypothetical protein